MIKLRSFFPFAFFRFLGQFLVAFFIGFRFIFCSIICMFSIVFPTAQTTLLLGHLCIFRGRQAKKLICKFCLWRKNIYNKLNLQPKRTEPSRNETKRNGAQQKANKMLDKLRIRRLVAAWQMKMLIGFPCLLAAPSMKPAKLAYLIRLASASCLPSKWCVVAGKKGQKYMQHHKLQQCGQPSRAPLATQPENKERYMHFVRNAGSAESGG